MGNWRTVTIQGECDVKELPALESALDPGKDWDNWHCLVNTEGLAGLGNWADEHIDRSGNLAERDYTVEDVAEALTQIVDKVPSLKVKVHCGGDWEDKKCIATITASKDRVEIGPPEIEYVRGVSDDELTGRLVNALKKPPKQ